MYSEDKDMLRKTLIGISKNILEFNQKGIASHEIGVFVIMDGIEHVDKSVVDFYEALEHQNSIYLDPDIDKISP